MGDHFFKLPQAAFSLVWRCRIVDRENIPGQGPAVLVSNHLGSYAPVAVHKTAQAMKIGTAVAYDPGNIFSLERDRIKTTLQNRIVEMYRSLPA